MTRVETGRAGAMVAVTPRARLASPGPGAPRAAFVSQLIAEHLHMAPQRQLRRAPLLDALTTYESGGKLNVRRLPVGYRLSLDA